MLSFVLVAMALLSLYLYQPALLPTCLCAGWKTSLLLPLRICREQGAIVVLGIPGVTSYTPEHATTSSLLRQRLDYAIQAARESKLPVLVTGGEPYDLMSRR